MAIETPFEREIYSLYDDLREENAQRDVRHSLVRRARRGDMESLLPGFFPDGLGKQMTANVVNIAAAQLGEMVGALPDISCNPDRFTSQAAKKAADKRTKIANGYAHTSRLEIALPSGGDWLVTYGALPLIVESDFDTNSPVIRLDNPVGSYYRTDMFGRVKHYMKRWYDTAGRLAAMFPDSADEIYNRHRTSPFGTIQHAEDNSTIEVVKYYGPNYCALFLPDRQCVLAYYENVIKGRPPVFIAERPKWDEEVRGQFDEMLWVQVARALLSTLSLEATHKSVTAPLVLPRDVTKMAYGPDAIIRTDNPAGVGRVGLEVPVSAFQENALLQAEERLAARFPEAASGNLDASIITGQGINALLSTMDSQVKVLQTMVATALSDALSYAMELDETYFGDMEKYSKGRANGSRFSMRYTPSKDIAGDYEVECTYGFATGLDANRGLVFMLQAQGAGLLDKDSIMRKLPLDIDPTEVQERIDIEQLNDALKQGLFGLGAAFPQMAQMGQDPQEAISRLTRVIEARQKGKALHEAVQKAYEPTKEEQAAAAQQQQDPLAALLGGGAPGGAPGGEAIDPNALPTGGRPDVMSMIAGLSAGGSPNLQAGVMRQQAAA